MKQLVCLVCLLALLLSACSVTEQTPAIPNPGTYLLTFNAENLFNDHVGNSWTITYTHNGQTVESGYTITQSPDIFTFQHIGVEVRENDQIDDIGTGTLDVAICDGCLSQTKVTVTETNGRYKGNAAVWEITCEVALLD